MIKHLITGGCSFSVGGPTSGWTGALTKYLEGKNSNLTTDHTAEISQGQELIQKKVILAITDALSGGLLPEEILVSVAWSSTHRKAWYIDNPDIINSLVNGWRDYPSGCSTQFVDLKYYKIHCGEPSSFRYEVYSTKNSSANYNPNGGWYFTLNGSDSSVEGIRQYYLLDQYFAGPGQIHCSLENMIFLQNFCRLKGITLIQQIFMNDVFEDIIKNKDHHIIKYLFEQLDLDNFVKIGIFDYALSLAGLTKKDWQSTSWEEQEKILEIQDILTNDHYHPSEYAFNQYFDTVLLPFLKDRNI